MPHPREAALCEAEVQMACNLEGAFDVGRRLGDKVGEVQQNACYLLLLVGLKDLEPVVEVNDPCGLNEQCHSAVRLVVNDRLYGILEFPLDRNDISVVAHRHDTVLNGTRVCVAGKNVLQHLVDGLLEFDFLASDRGNVDGRVVQHLAVLVHAPLDLLGKRREGLDVLRNAEQ